MERKLDTSLGSFIKSNLKFLSIIFFVGLVVFYPSFITAVYGDEWKIFWLGESAIQKSGNIFTQQPTDISYIFEIVVFNIVSKVFGYDGTPYYLLSYLSRFVAATALCWLLIQNRLGKMAAVIGSLLFMISPVGIETTDWVRNFDSYLAIPLIIFTINLINNLNSKRDLVKVTIYFFLTILVNTTRSHGVFFLFLGYLLYKMLIYRTKRTLLGLSILTMIFTYLAFSSTPIFGGQLEKLFNNFNFSEFSYSFFLNYRSGIIPYVSTSDFKFSFYLGLLFFLSLGIFVIYLRKTKYQSLILLAFLFSFCFLLIPLIRIPQIHASFEHRYLIFSALTIPIIISIILDILKNKVVKIFMFILSILTILSFALITLQYLNRQKDIHSQEYTNKIWREMGNKIGKYSNDLNRLSVIILTDRESRQKVDNPVAFGFNYHFGLIYKIWTDKELPPVWVVEGNKIEKENIHPSILDPARKIIVLEIKGGEVKDITPTAKL